MIAKDQWEWFGFAGHLCVGQWCRFHLATKIGKYWISTVGMYVHPRHGEGREQAEQTYLEQHPNGEEIGAGRTYETMVFRVKDGLCDCGCGQPAIDFEEQDSDGYNDAVAARTGHLRMCEKWAAVDGEVSTVRRLLAVIIRRGNWNIWTRRYPRSGRKGAGVG